jgi:hypothetical protein
MEVRDALKLSRDFIFENLGARSGSLDATAASFDHKSETWDVNYRFIKDNTGNWVEVRLFIDICDGSIREFEQIED